MTRFRGTITVGAVLASFLIASAGVANATPSKWQPLHAEGGPEVIQDFCGVPGLTVENTFVADGRFRITAHGPDQLPHYVEFVNSTDTWTNVASGAYVTIVASFRSADHKVTDNGDGTLTVIVQTPHNNVVYDQDGQVIARRAGLFRDEVFIDNGGTPTDPSDDQFLGYGQRVKNVGLGFDFCAVLVQAIG
jgi:hypothetical protein